MLKGDKGEPVRVYPDQLAGTPSEMRRKLGDAATRLQEHALFPRALTNDTANAILPLLDLGTNLEYPGRHYYLFTGGTLLDIPKSEDGRLLWDKRREVEEDDREVVKVGQTALDAVEIRIESQRLDLLDE